MTSEAQYKGGYPNEAEPVTEETQSFCITIPAGEAYRVAAYAQLTMLGKWWKWKREESGTLAKLSAETWRLLFEMNEDCEGDFNMTPEELAEAICDGLVCAAPRIGLMLAAGKGSDASFDEDGNIDIPTSETGGEDLPEDDPATPIDETKSAYYGGIIEIASKLELVWDKIDALFGVPSGAVTPVTPMEDAQAIMIAYFPCEFIIMQQAVDDYYAWRLAGATQIAFTQTSAFPLYLYCNGYDYNALARWMIDQSGWVWSKQQIALKFWEALADSFFTHYFSLGSAKPSNAYLDAACVPMPYQEFIDVPYASVRNLSPVIAKGGHRLKIRVSGYYVDPDGDIQDPFWYRTAAGVLTRSNFTFSHGAGANMPSDNQVPYSPTHVYEYTIDLFNGSSSWSVTFNRNAGMNVASTSPTGGFDIQITDLGQAISS